MQHRVRNTILEEGRDMFWILRFAILFESFGLIHTRSPARCVKTWNTVVGIIIS